MPQDSLRELKDYLLEIAHLRALLDLLEWDQLVNMSSSHKGHKARAELAAHVAGLKHRKATSDEYGERLEKAKIFVEQGHFEPREVCIVEQALIDHQRDSKLSPEFIEEQTRVHSEAQQVWEKAKETSDFALFAPYLKQIVALKRVEAGFVMERGQTLYDALLDDYEPNYGSERLEGIFQGLKKFLVPFIQAITDSSKSIDPKIIKRRVSHESQNKFARVVARKIGYDMGSGGIHQSVHPFSTSFHPTDARITYRYAQKSFVNDCLMSVIHESGHAMYEQGFLPEFFGTPMAEAVSFGIHESQSRFWENNVGRSAHFWSYFYPKMQKSIPQFRNISLVDFYGALNCVRPSLVRVDADEVTYNLHIILRFEIEKALINGEIEVEDLPSAWNQKSWDYFGLKVKKDSEGVLQDVHWSDGSFGYFPSYGLGNLYAAQFFEAALRDMPDLNLKISQGKFGDLLKWLRKNIHIHGRLYSAEELLVKITGEGFSQDAFIRYLKDKYIPLYDLKI